MKKKLTEKQKNFLEIFEKSAGNVSQACKKVNISRETHYRWRDESDTYKKASNDIKEGLIDFAETQLMKNIRDGRETSLIFFLKTQAKKRGYIEKQEIEHGTADGLPLEWTVTIKKPDNE